MKTIDKFDGVHNFLSNFYKSSRPIEHEGLYYVTVENAYQAAKTLDVEERKKFLYIEPYEAKKLGCNLNLRQDWDKVKLDIMLLLLRQKFRQGPERYELLMTGDKTLIEGNYWGDQYWGVCKGEGSNHLGRLLMEIREQIGAEYGFKYTPVSSRSWGRVVSDDVPRRNETMNNFIEYCRNHPDERFWQALRNWSVYDVIWGAKDSPTDTESEMEDTFYREGK